MPAARYWRLVGCAPYGHDSDLSISELGLYEAATRQDTGPTCTYAPISGSLSSLADNSTGTLATFAAEDLTKANFGFYWDLGASINVDSLAVGSAAARSTFLARGTLQMRLSSGEWLTVSNVNGLTYPGANALATVTKFRSRSPILRLRFEGADDALLSNSLVNDYGSLPTFTSLGGSTARLSSAQAYEGATSARFPTNGSAIFADQNDGLAFRFDGSYVNTVATWLYVDSSSQAVLHLAGAYYRDSGGAEEGWWLATTSSGFLGGRARFSANAAAGAAGTTSVSITSSVAVPLQQWFHAAFERVKDDFYLYLNGQIVAQTTVANCPVFVGWAGPTQRPLTIGGVKSFNSNFAGLIGHIDDFVLGADSAFYGGQPFTPGLYSDQVGDSPSAHALEPNASLAAADRDIKLFTPQSVNTQLRETLPSESRNDTFFGGRGVINGTVKEKSTPANLPLFRKVRLIDERSGYVVAETWSDATTGNYSFANIDRSRTYTVVSYDHTGLYRAVIADRLTPELMT